MLIMTSEYMATDTVVAVRVGPGQWTISHWRNVLFDDQEVLAYVKTVWEEELRMTAISERPQA